MCNMLRVLGVTILLRLCLSFLVTWRHITSFLHHGSSAARCSGPPGAQHADDLVGIAVLLGEIPLLVAHLEEGLDGEGSELIRAGSLSRKVIRKISSSFKMRCKRH